MEERIYRNIWKEIGISDAQVEERLSQLISTFFYDEKERLYFPVGDDMAYIEDTGNNDARTEGMSYGMMLCVQLDMKEEFDRIWKWAKTYMYMEEGENEGYFAWSCQTDGTKNSYGPAPDGEEYFAMALFFASHRWGDGEGIFAYEKEAKELLRACIHKGENGRPGEPMWNRENKQILFVPGSTFTDPSYHLPHFYELFAKWAYEEDRPFWAEAAKVSRQFMKQSSHPQTGMSPEYAEFDGSPVKQVFSWGRHDWFYSDAYRTAANIGLDYAWFQTDIDQTQAVSRLQYTLGVINKENPYMTYEVDGTVLDQEALHPVGLLATTAEGSLAVLKKPLDLDLQQLAGNFLEDRSICESDEERLALWWIKTFWETPLRTGKRRYYDNCLYMFAFLALAGKYRIW